MEKIHDINNDFDFNQLNISSPISKAGGYHLLKFSVNNTPLYIQPPKCTTKNGIIKTKKMYTDLMFSNENDKFMEWLENLESYCQNYIYKNRESFFEGSLEFDDIESYFISPQKLFNRGKYYLVRVNIPTVLGKPVLKIYDESENEVIIDSITNETELTSILEFKGVKCSARSFQIDIEVKQMMKMEKVQLFSKCLIKPTQKTNVVKKNKDIELIVDTGVDDNDTEISNDDDVGVNNTELTESKDDDNNIDRDNIEDDKQEDNKEEESIILDKKIEKNSENDLGDNNDINTDILEEIQLDSGILESNDVVQIKEANEVYYKMYKEAIKRARLARDLALNSFMEARNIKNKYMLDEALIDSEDESDLEKELEEEEE